MSKVQRFFKRTEHTPFTYPSIEERKGKSHFLVWAFIFISVVALGIIAFLIF